MRLSLKAITLTMAAVLTASAVIAQQPQAPEHVIFIGLDGWGGYSLPKADMPNLKALMDQGAYTLTKRSSLPSSSAINWASIFMGASTEAHGYTDWDSKTPEIPSAATSEHGIFPTIFTIARRQNPQAELGVLYEWDGIKHLVDTLALSRHAHLPAIDGMDSRPITDAAVAYITEQRPLLAAFVYDNPDHVGHGAGHDTPEYYAVLTQLDSYIGEIVEATKKAGIYDSTVFVITSDHGGIRKGHGGKTLAEMETPLILAGPGVRRIGRLQSSVMQPDVAPTMAVLLGLTEPQPWTGKPISEALTLPHR